MMALYENALKDLERAYQNMRDNITINYTQLGLAFNIGLTKIYLGQTAPGMIDLRKAQEEKMMPEHSFIDDAVRDRGRGCNVFTVPVSQSPGLA
jgi:neutrophil factor 2